MGPLYIRHEIWAADKARVFIFCKYLLTNKTTKFVHLKDVVPYSVVAGIT